MGGGGRSTHTDVKTDVGSKHYRNGDAKGHKQPWGAGRGGEQTSLKLGEAAENSFVPAQPC